MISQSKIDNFNNLKSSNSLIEKNSMNEENNSFFEENFNKNKWPRKIKFQTENILVNFNYSDG